MKKIFKKLSGFGSKLASSINNAEISVDRESMRKCGLIVTFIDYIETHDSRHPLNFRCQSPFYCYSSPIMQQNIIPLWECGTTVSYYNCDSRKYERCNLENTNSLDYSYSSLPSALAVLFIELFEDEMNDEDLNRISDLTGFEHLDRMLSEISITEDYANWRKLFPQSCEFGSQKS